MNAIAEYLQTKASDTQPHLHPITVTAYHRMAEIGIIAATQRTELIEARIFNMSPIGTQHADWVNRLARFFIKAVDDTITVSIQNPVYLNATNEPQPDIALLHPRQIPYRERHPQRDDVLLIIEVADTSYQFDRRVKVPLYAQHEVPEFWLLNVAANRLDIYRDPLAGEYQIHLRPQRDEQITLFALGEVTVNLEHLFEFY